MYENVPDMVLEYFYNASKKPLATAAAKHLGLSIWVVSELGQLMVAL